MRIEFQDDKPVFKPIKIVLETPEEVSVLWHSLNTRPGENYIRVEKIDSNKLLCISSDLWNILDKFLWNYEIKERVVDSIKYR